MANTKKLTGVLEIDKNVSKFYRIEVMKIAAQIIMQSEKHELYLNSQMTSENATIIDFIEISFSKNKGTYKLNLELLSVGTSIKTVKLVNIREENILYYTRLGIYELLFGKDYVRDYLEKIKKESMEHKKSLDQRKAHSSKIINEEVDSFLNKNFSSSDTAKKPPKKPSEKEKMASTSSENETGSSSVSSSVNSEKKMNPKKDQIQNEIIKKPKPIFVLEDRNKANKGRSSAPSANSMRGDKLEKNNEIKSNSRIENSISPTLDSYSENQTPGIVREYEKRFRRENVSTISVNFVEKTNYTKDILTTEYKMHELSFGGTYDLSLDYSEKDSINFDLNLNKPMEEVYVTINNNKSTLQMGITYDMSAIYNHFIPGMFSFVVGGLSIKKKEFINLPVRNEGLVVGVLSTIEIVAGIKYDTELFKNRFYTSGVFQKVFWGGVDYGNVGSSMNIDGLSFRATAGFGILKKIDGELNFSQSKYTSRERVGFEDNSTVLDFGLIYKL